MIVHICSNIFNDLEINFWMAFLYNKISIHTFDILLYLMDIKSYLIISYCFFVSVQPSRQSLTGYYIPQYILKVLRIVKCNADECWLIFQRIIHCFDVIEILYKYLENCLTHFSINAKSKDDESNVLPLCYCHWPYERFAKKLWHIKTFLFRF